MSRTNDEYSSSEDSSHSSAEDDDDDRQQVSSQGFGDEAHNHVQLYAPPLPSTDARLQQYEACGVSFSSNTSAVNDPNMDAAGALLQMNSSFETY